VLLEDIDSAGLIRRHDPKAEAVAGAVERQPVLELVERAPSVTALALFSSCRRESLEGDDKDGFRRAVDSISLERDDGGKRYTLEALRKQARTV
jgi:hypothetical protein